MGLETAPQMNQQLWSCPCLAKEGRSLRQPMAESTSSRLRWIPRQVIDIVLIKKPAEHVVIIITNS